MSRLARDEFGIPAPVIGLGASQDVAVGASSAQSTALGASTTMVRLVSTVDCRVALGENPTATATSTLLPAGCPEVFAVQPRHKVAVIQTSGAGTLNLTEVA